MKIVKYNKPWQNLLDKIMSIFLTTPIFEKIKKADQFAILFYFIFGVNHKNKKFWNGTG